MFKEKLLVFVYLIAASSASAQTAPNDAPKQEEEDTQVVAVIDGEEYTVEDIRRLRENLPEQYKRQTMRFSHRDFLENYRQLMGLARAAEKRGIDEKEPYRTQLEYNRMLFLAQVFTKDLSQTLDIPSQENLDYYEAHKDDFRELRVSAIYVDYSPDGSNEGELSENALSQEQARARAEALVAELRQGADFAEMARKHSHDVVSAEKGGDLGFFSRKSSLPSVLKRTIFSLNEGEISDPVKEGGRFYIFTVTDTRIPPYRDVAVDVVSRVRGLKMKEKLDEIRFSIPLEYKDEDFLNRTPMTPGASQTVPLNIQSPQRGPGENQ